jgi:dCMP deaminase
MEFWDFFTHYGDPLRDMKTSSTSTSKESPLNTESAGRLDRKEFYKEMVQLYQRRSTCLRLQVGAIIVRDGRVISGGYNGAPAGMAHCTADICGPEKPCTRTIHAEANAIAFAAKYGIATQDCGMWITDSPCNECAKLIINAGISSVIFLRPYRDEAPTDLLVKAGVNVKFYAPLAPSKSFYGSSG